MRILVVGRRRKDLEQRTACLRQLYPDAELVAEYDAMSAVKYAFNHDVDAVYTEVQTKPIGGFDVVRLVRKVCPDVLTYLIAETDAYLNRAAEAHVDGYYLMPTSAETLRSGNILHWEAAAPC
ncbi:hypothetical protein [Zongyangia hominis]|uniref:Response regulatory domain-containing protein n=1 Tax=Zongyangia hominis TaxID=2763677 RepID=A0A926EC12_9FIRM|nr:hypothetical protein [Zongyangia hominis]MBC8570293.1 hypothetical protein [Zongyangia hominis]